MKLYDELADWWPLLSAPEDYAEEADFYQRLLLGADDDGAATLLELGSGGGNNASFLKRRFEMVLVDLAPAMVEVSRRLNPECEHVVGDMRTVRLGRSFDRVFVHDAISYLTTEDDLRAAIETVRVHLRPGGRAVLAPDYVAETFDPGTEHGGHDGPERGLRYLAWVWDPDPGDTTFVTDYAYLLRQPDGRVHAEHDRHVEGLFPRRTWLELLAGAGFETEVVPLEHSEVEPGTHEVFVLTRPADDPPR